MSKSMRFIHMRHNIRDSAAVSKTPSASGRLEDPEHRGKITNGFSKDQQVHLWQCYNGRFSFLTV